MKTCLLFLFFISFSIALPAQWTAVNIPATYQFDLLARQGDSVLVRSLDKHLYRSTDGAQTWEDITAGYPAGSDPSYIERSVFKGDLLVVGTFDVGVIVFGANGWESRNTGLSIGTYTTGLCTDGNYLAVSVYNTDNGSSGSFISADEGLHWSPLPQPSTPDLFQGDLNWVDHRLFWSGGGLGFYSDNFGQNWTPFPGNAEPGYSGVFANDDYGYGTIAMVGSGNTLYTSLATGLDTAYGLPTLDILKDLSLARANDGRLYAAATVVDASSTDYLLLSQAYVSADSGRHWVAAQQMPHEKYDFLIGGSTLLWSEGGKMILSDNNKLYNSIDNGVSWQEHNPPGMSSTGKKHLFTTNLSGKFLAATDFGTGLYVQTTDQNTWQNANSGIPSSPDYPQWLTKTNQSWQCAANFGYCTDGIDNATWSRCFPAPPQMVATSGDTILFRDSYGGTMWRSDDNGQSWQDLGKPPFTNSIAYLYYLNSHKHQFYAGVGSAYLVSEDQGQTWIKHNVSATPLGQVRDMFFTDSIWYTALGQYIYTSVDSGATWSLLKNLQTSVASVLTTGAYYLGGTASGLRRSADGVQWSTVPNLSDCIFATADGLTEFGGVVFAAGSKGIYASTDQGGTWFDFNQGLPTGVIGLQVLLDNNQLYAVTNQGIFHRPFSNLMVRVHEPVTLALEISPNPAVDLLHVGGEAGSLVDIQVFNAQGYLVRNTKEVGLPADLSIDNLPAGIYMMRIRSERGTAARQFLKL